MRPVFAHVLGAISIAATLLPLNPTGRGWVRVWDFPRLQIAGLAAVALASLCAGPRNGAAPALFAGGLVGAIVFQASRVWRYSPLYPKQVLRSLIQDPERSLRILTSNVFQENRSYQRLLDVVRDSHPDLVLVMETDRAWEHALRPLEAEYRFTVKCSLDNTYGMMLYSRLPLEDPEVRFLIEDDIPSIRASVRLRNGRSVMLYCLHPRPPLPGSPSYARDAELVSVGREIRHAGRPAVIVGDMNDVAWSDTTRLFQRVSRALDPRVGRGLYNTFHVRQPLLRYPLDHVFHTPEFTLVQLRRLPDVGSDHFPMLVELAYEPAAAPVQPPEEMQPQDHQRAVEILDDVREHNVN
ncbi:MAG: endonuclease/exonuclease/phosphatase family protein [Bryobacteraceae bacterium]|nr:endonuclease/exonuclease/phosphatase family protein [Bryobacteraceae bacterium]